MKIAQISSFNLQKANQQKTLYPKLSLQTDTVSFSAKLKKTDNKTTSHNITESIQLGEKLYSKLLTGSSKKEITKILQEELPQVSILPLGRIKDQVAFEDRYSAYFTSKIDDDFSMNRPIIYLNEVPFKIGDKVKDSSDNEVGIILGFIDIDGELMYVVDFEKSGHAKMPVEELKPYEEMKEERNITLTLEKAKEWYKKGGELKEIALQAFTERELNPLPRSWKEFCEKYPVKKGECILESEDMITVVPRDCRGNRIYKNWIPSKESAEAHLAMI